MLRSLSWAGLLLALAGLLLVPAARVSAGGRVLQVRTGRTIDFRQMTAELASARAVFVGEVHDVPEHHWMQLAVIDALHEEGVPLAIGLEMFRAENQAGLDRWVAGRITERAFRKLYEKNWTLPWNLYADLFRYARDQGIPLIGLNVPESVTSKVARSGFASLTKKELRQLPAGIACEVDDTYMDFIRRSHGAHGSAGRSFRFFCEAQMVWDGVMAKGIADYLERNPGRHMVVLAGSGHAWRRGIPARLKVYAPRLRSLVVIPSIDAETEPGTVTTDDADYVVL